MLVDDGWDSLRAVIALDSESMHNALHLHHAIAGMIFGAAVQFLAVCGRKPVHDGGYSTWRVCLAAADSLRGMATRRTGRTGGRGWMCSGASALLLRGAKVASRVEETSGHPKKDWRHILAGAIDGACRSM